MDAVSNPNAIEKNEENIVDTASCTVIDNCPIPTDITLVSSDGQHLSTHTKNLADFTGSFPTDIKPEKGVNELVSMPDLDGETLRIFLQYVHHCRQPNISSLVPEKLAMLAEAVEKYEVYSATEVCRLQMHARLESKTLDTLKAFKYATKHGYVELYNKAAEIMVADHYKGKFMVLALDEGSPFADALAKYFKHWPREFDVLRNPPEPPQMHKGGRPTCKKWKGFEGIIRRQTTGDDKCVPEMFPGFGKIIEDNMHLIEGCSYCCSRADRWSHVGSSHTFAPLSSFL